MNNEMLMASPSSIAQALAADYFCIYYVNVENDRFIEYSSSEEYKAFHLPSSGDDFISFSRKHFEELIDPEDRERFLTAFTKEHIVSVLDSGSTFTMTFRMLFRGVSTYVHLKVTRMIEKEGKHAVIGISSIDDQMRARAAFENAHRVSMTYSRIAQALAADYFSIYIVEPDNDRFTEYSSTQGYEQLGVEKAGEDFFASSRKNMERLLYPEDKDRFLRIFTKENILSSIRRDGHFTTKYRLIFKGEPVYVSLKATLMEDETGSHLIIGTNNIDAQMKREEEYRKMADQAKEDARSDFLANMSHDIRTPMNAIIGYTDIAVKHYDDPETVKDSLEKIGSSGHFLLSLINDILDISKIEKGQVKLNPDHCDLNDIFRRIEDITALQARNKSLKISYDHKNVVHSEVLADELRIEQILINIISNAIKYTPSGGEVRLKAEEEVLSDDESLYRFLIEDTGIGISEDYLPHIFESFSREEKTTVNRIQGTGLGLAITARIVELMDGKISVSSKLGEGSLFTVELVLRKTEGSKEEIVTEEGTDLKGRRVLIVEDNAINAEIVKMVLEQYEILFDTAENGLEAFKKLKDDKSYDAVLMDIQMPVKNGYEATRDIRSLPESYYRDLPIIAMSANAFEEDVRRCIESGMNAHIAKPFRPDILIDMLKKYICKDS